MPESTDHRFIRNARLVVIAEAIVRLRMLIFMPFLTRHLGTVNYGVWSQLGVIVAAVAPIAAAGVDLGVVRFTAGLPRKQQQQNFSAALIFGLCSTTLVGGVLLVFGTKVLELFLGKAGPEYMSLMPFVALSIPVQRVFTTVLHWYKAQNNAIAILVTSVGRVILYSGVLVVVLAHHWSVRELLIGKLAVELALVLVTLSMLTRDYGWSRPDFSVVRKMLRFGLPLLPAAYAVWGLNSVDRVFLAKYSTMKEIGVYGVAYSLGYIIIPFCIRPFRAMFGGEATELYNQGDMDGVQRVFNRSAGIALALAVPAVVGLAVIGESLLRLLVGPAFVVGAPLVPMIACGYVLTVFASYYSISLGLVHQQRYTSVAAITACVVNVALNYLLIPGFSMAGAATATLVSFGVQLAIVSVAERKLAGILKTNVRFLGRVVAASCLMGGTLLLLRWGIRRWLPSMYFELFGLSLVGVVLYGVFGKALGVHNEDCRTMFSWLRFFTSGGKHGGLSSTSRTGENSRMTHGADQSE